MSSKKQNSFKLVIPQNKDIDKNLNNAKTERIKFLKDNIKKQYEELCGSQEVQITEENKEIIEDTILATKDLIDNCIKDNYYNGNRDENFINLTYVCHKLDLKLETYKLELKIEEIKQKNINMNNIQKEIKERQEKMEEQSNNLVYNLLGFLASFSIVSAAVSAISEIKSTLNVMIFMAFTILILLTTLIALNNFYKKDNKREIKLQDNYFLWKATAVVIILLVIISGVICLRENKEKIFNYIDEKIEKVIERKINESKNLTFSQISLHKANNIKS